MRWKSKYNWKRWFAWRPVYSYVDHTWIWLEVIERRWESCVSWEYRLLDTDTFFKLPVSERYKRMSAGR